MALLAEPTLVGTTSEDESVSLSVREVAALLSCHPETVRRHLRAGVLGPSAYKLGRVWRVSQADVHALLNREKS